MKQYHFLKVLHYLFSRFWAEGFSYRAASLAYTTLLGVVPMAFVGATVLSFFPFFQGVEVKLQQLVLDNFVADSGAVIAQYIGEFLTHVGSLPKFSIIFLVLIGLLMIYNISRAFNAVWHSRGHFAFSLSFLMYSLVLFVSPILLGFVLLVGNYFFKLPFVSGVVTISYVHSMVFWMLPHIVVFVAFTLLNWILPACRVKLLHAMVGGAVSMVLFGLAKAGFVLYLTKFSSYRLLYGALATIPIFLIWLYVSWIIILFSALVTYWVDEGIPKHWIKKHYPV